MGLRFNRGPTMCRWTEDVAYDRLSLTLKATYPRLLLKEMRVLRYLAVSLIADAGLSPRRMLVEPQNEERARVASDVVC